MLMADDWTVIIAIATSATALLGLLTLTLLEQQRRIRQNNPLYLGTSAKVQLLGLMESDARGEAGEELEAGMPSIARHSPDVSTGEWVGAVDSLMKYGLAEVYDNHLRVTEAGKRYAWRKYRGDVRATLLKVKGRNSNRG